MGVFQHILVPKSSSVEYYNVVIDPIAAVPSPSKISSGEAYRFVVAAGNPSGATFIPTAFGTSPLFSIKTGVETSVAIELKEIAIVTGLPGINLKSVVVSDPIAAPKITAAAGNAIYEGTGG
jgi:hypothetical protein